ncbi:replicative DNA helicase [Ectobacillus polymachus]|uniref:replicative DNA helicase n=1 Tax=Ectobacillus polymachus TaxID=1508806 RepID=UPI003A86F02A
MRIQNVEAEQMVLGSIILEGELLKECRLAEQHFSLALHQTIFKWMKQVVEEKLDLITLVSTMEPAFLEQIGGISFLATMAESVPTTANFSHYEDLVLRAWKMQSAANIAQGMYAKLHETKDENVIRTSITALCEIEEAEYKEDNDLKDGLEDLYESFQKDMGELSGIDTGFQALNQLTYGLQEGDFVVLGARPSMGKTAFALNISIHAAKNAAVGIVSLEMGREQLLRRMMSCVGKISGEKMKNPKRWFDRADWENTVRATVELAQLLITIYDKAGMKLHELYLQIRRLKRKHPDKKLLIIIDYLQLLSGDDNYRGNRQQEMSDISRKLKQLARDLHVCVLALSQLSRAIESRNDKRPLLSDLRETGQIEQDADVILLMYQNKYYDKKTENKDITEIQVAKHRNGPTGKVTLKFLKEYGRFVGNLVNLSFAGGI